MTVDQPGTATYPPNTLYASQTVGSGARISRLAIGTYQVRLLGFMAGRPAGGTVQVTSFNTPNFCNLASWIASGSDLLVNVRCWRTSNQTAVDAAFTLVPGVRMRSQKVAAAAVEGLAASAAGRALMTGLRQRHIKPAMKKIFAAAESGPGSG